MHNFSARKFDKKSDIQFINPLKIYTTIYSWQRFECRSLIKKNDDDGNARIPSQIVTPDAFRFN